MQKMLSDPVIDEIRAVRQRISARFDHNPARLIAYYQELQRRYADRMLDATTATKEATDHSAA
jgi:hypothetical protein